MSRDVHDHSVREVLNGLVNVCEHLESRIADLEASVRDVEKELNRESFGKVSLEVSEIQAMKSGIEAVRRKVNDLG